jgi:glycosyltransferase involved in cell wall biosynthesis
VRVVIDLQGGQGPNASRGIGRFSLNLAKAMIALRGSHEVLLALNGSFPEDVDAIRQAFATLLPQDSIRVWTVAGPVSGVERADDSRRLLAQMTREAFLAGLQPDVVLITSLFEGPAGHAVTSIGRFSRMTTAVVLYDLIPLIHRKLYLSNPVIEQWYFRKLDDLRRADFLLAISDSSGSEAVAHVGVPAERSYTVSCGFEDKFQPLVLDSTDAAYLDSRYGLTRPFVMYTGGIDPRKNVEGFIRAYALLPVDIQKRHQLAGIGYSCWQERTV